MRKAKISARVSLVLLLVALGATAGEIKPKYGPKDAPRATPLGQSRDYFQSRAHPSPDFWALIGYYVPQQDDHSCSAAALAMVLNAARVNVAKTADDELVTQKALLDKVTAEDWKQRLSAEGFNGVHGTTLEQFSRIAEAAFRAYGFNNVSVRTVHVDDSAAGRREVLAALAENEKSTKEFIVANFNQQAFTDDADAGHLAPVGAYDAKQGRVLILDPDRQWYEPYWVSVETFLAGISTEDKLAGNAHRGYVVITPGSL